MVAIEIVVCTHFLNGIQMSRFELNLYIVRELIDFSGLSYHDPCHPGRDVACNIVWLLFLQVQSFGWRFVGWQRYPSRGRITAVSERFRMVPLCLQPSTGNRREHPLAAVWPIRSCTERQSHPGPSGSWLIRKELLYMSQSFHPQNMMLANF